MSLFFNLVPSLDSYFYLGLLPEFLMISFILILIIIAITTPKIQKTFLLETFLQGFIYFYLFILTYYSYLLLSGLFPGHLTIFLCYQTLKLNQMLILIKMLLIFFALGSLMSVKRYLMLYQLI